MSVELGRLVEQRRLALGLSRRDLSDESGVSYPYVSQIETGDRDPSLRTMSKLAEVLDVPVEQMASMVVSVALTTVLPASRSRAERMSHDDSVELYRAKVLPSVERRLQSVPPLVRLELLAELTRGAAREAADEAGR